MRSITFSIILTSAVLIAGCGGSETTTNSSNTNTVNSNPAITTNSNNPLAVMTPAPEQTTNNAPTLTPVFKEYCAAMEKKDEAALRKVYSSDTIKYFESDMKETGDKSLVDYLSTDKTTSALCEARNESINGDSAVAEIRTQAYPTGIKVIFVKENGQWKLTNRSPEVPTKK